MIVREWAAPVGGEGLKMQARWLIVLPVLLLAGLALTACGES